jgi:hypothetical protein
MSAKEVFPIVITTLWSLSNEESIHAHCDVQRPTPHPT